MGLKQQPKCKDKTCQFCTGKYCTILKQKPDVGRFYKAWDDFRPPFCDMCGARMDGGVKE